MKNYPRTPDGRHFIVNGRKWRSTDPAIPEPLRQQLVNVLMKARGDVGGAKRAKDEAAEKAARKRVNDAKIALGERGEKWWEPYTDAGLRSRISSTLFTLLRGREADKSICPSEVARCIGAGESWRELMPTVREVAAELAKQNVLNITRGNDVLDPDAPGGGPIRLRRGAAFEGFGA